jgi:hypothetical protein
MTKQLENVFDLPELTREEMSQAIEVADNISREMRAVTMDDGLDKEIDDIAAKAMNSYEDLMNLGMNVEARFAAPIFDSASKMIGHAVTAKLGKAQKKLKEAELKLKAIKMGEMDRNTEDNVTEISATVWDRNQLIKSMKQ